MVAAHDPETECGVQALPSALLGRVWPADRALMGMRTCKWLQFELAHHADAVRVQGQFGIGELTAQEVSQTFNNLQSSSIDLWWRCRTVGPLVGGLAQSLAQGVAIALVRLNLCRIGIGDRGAVELATVLGQCKSLTEFDAGYNGFDVMGVTCLAESLCRQKLSMLNLAGNSIREEGARHLSAVLRDCHSLEKLDLSWGNDIGPVGARCLAEALCMCPGLKRLSLQNNAIGDVGATAVADVLAACARLEHLNLRYNDIGADGGRAVGNLLRCAGELQHLDLNRNALLDGGVLGIAINLQHCSALVHLDLCKVGMTPEGVAALCSGLPGCSGLKRLDLSENHVGCGGAGALAAVLGRCRKLQQLQLNHSRLTAAGAKRIAAVLGQCPQLKDLDLRTNQLGGECKAMLLKWSNEVPGLLFSDSAQSPYTRIL